MESFEHYVHRVFLGSLALVLVPAGILVLAGFGNLARGVVLGGAASLINLVLMALGIRRHSDTMHRFRAAASMGNYSLRMGILTAALIYAAVNDRVSLLATIPALFSVQAVLLLGGMVGWPEGPD